MRWTGLRAAVRVAAVVYAASAALAAIPTAAVEDVAPVLVTHRASQSVRIPALDCTVYAAVDAQELLEVHAMKVWGVGSIRCGSGSFMDASRGQDLLRVELTSSGKHCDVDSYGSSYNPATTSRSCNVGSSSGYAQVMVHVAWETRIDPFLTVPKGCISWYDSGGQPPVDPYLHVVCRLTAKLLLPNV